MPNYLYNGVELPELPSASGQYWYINYYGAPYIDGNIDITSYRLVNCDYPLYYNGRQYYYTQPTRYRQYGVDVDKGEWNYNWTGDNASYDIVGTPVIWANHNILNEDGSVYLPASDPVPVPDDPEQPETEPTTAPADLYKIKNGVGQTHDAYKRVGDQWVPLDEYNG